MFNVTFNCNISNYSNFRNKNVGKCIAFRGSLPDTFQKCATSAVDKTKLSKMLNNPSFRVDRKFLESLSPEAYEFCLNFAKGTEKIFAGLLPECRVSVLPEDVLDIAKYSQGFYKGIERVAKKNNIDVKDIMVVAIGQSPDSVVKAMEFKGLKTGYCPMSYLRHFNMPDEYVTQETIDKGFSHWKKYGFDLDSLFKEKFILFVDHKESGATLESFQRIIYKIQTLMQDKGHKGKKPAQTLFMSMKDLHRNARQSVFDTIGAREVEEHLFHPSYFKTLYSPLFKLPLDKISEIDELAKTNKEANKRFNKFSILLYDAMKHPKFSHEIKSTSKLRGQRESRLSAVMSEYFDPGVKYQYQKETSFLSDTLEGDIGDVVTYYDD